MRIAVLIPMFNSASTIGDTLVSLQRCANLEAVSAVYLSDDASTDETVETAEEAWTSHIPLKLIRYQQNNGVWGNKNRTIQLLMNEGFDWVLMLHSDDLVKPEWIDLMTARVKLVPDTIASISTSWDVLQADGVLIPGEEKPSEHPHVIIGSPLNVASTVRRGGWWHMSGAAIRPNAFIKIGGFNLNYPAYADIDWTCRALDQGWCIEFLPRSPVIYRMHSETVTARTKRLDLDLREELEIHRRFSHYLTIVEYLQIQFRVTYYALRRIARATLNRDVQKFRTSVQTFILALRYMARKRRQTSVSVS